MGASSAAALRLLSSNHNGGQVTAKRSRSRSPAVTVPSTPNKASLNNPSLAASLAASQQSPHDHSSTSAAAAEQSSLISSFLRLPASMFTPMIDMTSTQALVTLVSNKAIEKDHQTEGFTRRRGDEDHLIKLVKSLLVVTTKQPFPSPPPARSFGAHHVGMLVNPTHLRVTIDHHHHSRIGAALFVILHVHEVHACMMLMIDIWWP